MLIVDIIVFIITLLLLTMRLIYCINRAASVSIDWSHTR